MPETKMKRIWNLYKSFHMTFTEIDKELCLASGTAHDVVMSVLKYSDERKEVWAN